MPLQKFNFINKGFPLETSGNMVMFLRDSPNLFPSAHCFLLFRLQTVFPKEFFLLTSIAGRAMMDLEFLSPNSDLDTNCLLLII